MSEEEFAALHKKGLLILSRHDSPAAVAEVFAGEHPTDSHALLHFPSPSASAPAEDRVLWSRCIAKNEKNQRNSTCNFV